MSAAGGVRLALGIALVAALAVNAAAQPAPVVGASATYRWTSSVTGPAPVLIQTRDAGGQTTWSVAEEPTVPPPLLVTYGIVRGDARTYTLQIVTQQQPDGPPLSITQVTVDRRSGKATRSVIQRPKGLIATPESGLRPLREAAVPGGVREEVSVPAGRFTAVRGSVQDAQVWVSDQVPALGLVKGVWPSGTLELVQSASAGAKDLLAAR